MRRLPWAGRGGPGAEPAGKADGGADGQVSGGLAGKAGGGLAGVVALVLPLVLDDSALAVYILLGLAAIVTVGVSLLMGFAGQVSLGQGAFYGVGAYTAALLTLNGFPPLLGLVAAPLVAAVFAAVIGMPLLRLRGHHLAFATLAVQLILLSLAGQLEFTGGDIGLQGIPQFGIGSWEMADAAAYAWLTWAALALVMLITHHVIASRPGRALRALATSETAAASSGIPVGRYKLVVFALSAAFAGLAGGVYCFYTGYVAPGSFPVLISLQYIVMAVVGGLGTVWGAVAGATAITLLVQGLDRLAALPGMPTYAPSVLSYAVYALVLIVFVLFLPRGLVPALTRRNRSTGTGAAR